MTKLISDTEYLQKKKLPNISKFKGVNLSKGYNNPKCVCT